MKKVRDLLARNLDENIEEIIKLDQTDEETVYREITEYVVTERICIQYKDILKAIAEAPADPHEGIGVWISGFFGSGKSSFAKNLGYVLANSMVKREKASDLFKKQINDEQVINYIDFINKKISFEVIMFDVSAEKAVKKTTEKIAEIMYTVLLRELDYGQDYDIAELEIELEGEGNLDKFIALCEEKFNIPWKVVRKGAQKISRSSAILHDMDSLTYPSADSWAKAIGTRKADITVGKFVERVFELSARRRPGKALVFIIDEVGNYVARSADKIEDLRAVVEQLGKESKNRLKAKKITAPVWLIVTSQEKLDEVVAAIDSKRIELAKLQDRFKHRIDLAPADIREVATKRVLAKKETAVPLLSNFYQRSEGLLNSACRLERTSRYSEIKEEDFLQFYPYLPHFIDLSIDIMSGIRLQPGAPKQLGGSNRTIIKQAYEILVSDRTKLAEKKVGSLVTLDLIFELVEGSLSSEKQKDISDIRECFKKDPEDKGWTAKVAKAICLLEFVRDLPRTENNIAAVLIEEVGKPSPLPEVQKALKKLGKAQFIKNTEDGYKLQTAQEKSWETEKKSYLSPKPAERNVIKREIIGDIFSDTKLKNYRFKNLRNFKIRISVDGVKTGDDGQISLSVIVAEDAGEFPQKLEEARNESRHKSHENDIYWVMAFNSEIDELIAHTCASRQMVVKYDQLRAHNKISQIELNCLTNEKLEQSRILKRLREKMAENITGGTGIFRGVSRDGSALGKSIQDVFKNLFNFAVPDLYPKLEMGARSLKGNEAEEILKAANLNGLSQVFYSGDEGLNLVIQKGNKYVPNPSADIAKEVLNYLNSQHAYGNKVTGKDLEKYFQGTGYGWDLDVVQLVLAVLLRAGAIEITCQSKRYCNHQDPQSKVTLTNNKAFRSASFAPRAAIDIRTLATAAKHYEEIKGEEVDVEEGPISGAFKKLAKEELEKLISLEATVKANNLPAGDIIREYKETLEEIINCPSDDCVRILSGEGMTFKSTRETVMKIHIALSTQGVNTIKKAGLVMERMWPVMNTRVDTVVTEQARELDELLTSPLFYEKIKEIGKLADGIRDEYDRLYRDIHEKRTELFNKVVEDIKGIPEWAELNEDMKKTVIQVLVSKACPELELEKDSLTCCSCKAGIGTLETDMLKLSDLKTQVIIRIQEETKPTDFIMSVHISDILPQIPIKTEEDIEEAIEQLKDYLHKKIAEGVTIILN